MKALVCIHGFGRLKTIDFDYLRAQFADSYIHYVDFDLYDSDGTPDWREWVKVAYKEVKQICDEGYEVTLLGFSMGGVIAGYLSSRLPIQKLVLVAPAYVYLGIGSGSRYMNRLAKLHLQGSSELQTFVEARWLDVSFIMNFMELVRILKPSVKEIAIPVLILHATKDDIVPVYSSRSTLRRIPHKQKKLYLLDGGNHEVLNDKKLKKEAYYQIVNFMEGSL